MYERGIHELADIKYRILHLLPFSSLLSISTLLLYFAFRLKSLLTTRNDAWNVLNSALYFVAEWGLLCESSISAYIYASTLTYDSSCLFEPRTPMSVFLRTEQSPTS